MEQFQHFDPEMATFAKRAFDDRWIEAEDRSGKRPGGFCTNFGVSNQSRIFMTYSGTAGQYQHLGPNQLGTCLSSACDDRSAGDGPQYAMNVAETASTFAESIVSDASIRHASTEERRSLALLEDKIQRAVAFFMDIHARFLFETRFYEERKKGLVSPERLKELILEAEKEAFCDGLEEYHPYFGLPSSTFTSRECPSITSLTPSAFSSARACMVVP